MCIMTFDFICDQLISIRLRKNSKKTCLWSAKYDEILKCTYILIFSFVLEILNTIFVPWVRHFKQFSNLTILNTREKPVSLHFNKIVLRNKVKQLIS